MHDDEFDLLDFDHYIVAFSGGKDSLAALLHLMESGVDASRIELWHHDVDGREGSTLMDWPCTRDYVKKVADAFGLKLYFSWKVGGFEGEMNRHNSPTAAVAFETPEGLRYSGGQSPKLGTRQKFPQVSADLSVRWCSAYLKIDVATKAINNQERFNNKRVLLITGERGEESANRARYAEFEAHKSTSKRKGRMVFQWRPVLRWLEPQVWDAIERWNINPHPAYRLGWGRVSCAACIFGSKDQWASLLKIAPAKVNRIADYEASFGVTIQRKEGVLAQAMKGVPYPDMKTADIVAAMSHAFTEPILVPSGAWVLPAGAYAGSCGGPS